MPVNTCRTPGGMRQGSRTARDPSLERSGLLKYLGRPVYGDLVEVHVHAGPPGCDLETPAQYSLGRRQASQVPLGASVQRGEAQASERQSAPRVTVGGLRAVVADLLGRAITRVENLGGDGDQQGKPATGARTGVVGLGGAAQDGPQGTGVLCGVFEQGHELLKVSVARVNIGCHDSQSREGHPLVPFRFRSGVVNCLFYIMVMVCLSSKLKRPPQGCCIRGGLVVDLLSTSWVVDDYKKVY